jgi:hypothetical protein
MSKVRSLKNDLEFGLSKEEPVRQLMKSIFTDEEDIINTKDLYNDEYCKFDYEGTTIKRRYEVKSRTTTKHKYPTTIIPVHKINKETTENGLCLIFNFTDKCSYIMYDPELFKTFKTKMMKIFRDGKYDNPCLHYEIPIGNLIDMN